MPSTTERFDLLDFHDATIEEIIVAGSTIEIRLGFANIMESHPSNPYAVAKCIENCTLLFESVKEATANLYSDSEKKFVPHPDPTAPIEWEILEAEEMPGKGFSLKGMHSLGWSEWLIFCPEFQLNWVAFSNDAWFVNRPPK